MINVDLKDLQERAYPAVLFEQAAHDVDPGGPVQHQFYAPVFARR